MKRRFFVTIAYLVVVAMTGCDTLAGFFNQRSTKLIIINETDFVAGPKIRTSNSRNFVEDSFSTGTLLTGFGENGMLAPGQSATITLNCDELETVVLDGATFEDATFGFPLGDANDQKFMRRDTDFDCGDTIRIRLSGTLFNYKAAATVETNTTDDGSADVDESNAGGLEDLFGGGNTGGEEDNESNSGTGEDDGDDIADKLDDLFN